MKIYVTYIFDSKEDRDNYYQEIKKYKIAELSKKDKGCLNYVYTIEEDRTLSLFEEWKHTEDQKKHLESPHMSVLKELKNKYHCKTRIQHGTSSIDTKRLLLRPFTIEDGEEMYNNWAKDERVVRYLTWPVHESIEVTHQVLSSWISQYDQKDYYQWGIVLKESGELIGNISVTHVDHKTNTVEVGYCLEYDYWGNGYMAEALRSTIIYLFSEGFDLVRARHDTNNPNSGKVMKKAGMVYEGTLRKSNRNNQGVVDDVFYSIIPEEI